MDKNITVEQLAAAEAEKHFLRRREKREECVSSRAAMKNGYEA